MSRSARRCSSGFTLIEILVVLAIGSILAVLVVPSVGSLMRAYQLESTAQTVVNQLTFARQTAQTKGYAVQVRLYYLPDYNQATTSSPAVYRGMQAFIESAPPATGNVTVTPITRPYFFQTGVVMLNDSTKSTILNLGTPSANDSSNPLPVYNSNYKYQVFRFVPTGQTDLTSTETCLTLVMENAKLTSGLPANFQTIQIDPINGAIRSFRP